MSLAPGNRLGPYEITSQIGVGGMGEVYRATDSNLKRSVAIKVLPSVVAGDADRLARFQREAEMLAALNHPTIGAIYGFEKTADVTAIVMELVEGEDLSQRIARGAIPLDQALPIAKQIADALEAAHQQGIVHRDLKPANIKVRSDGTVKVLDFGLAKAMETGGSAAHDVTSSPTITSPAMMTRAGVILGTAAYMSPEQAKGKLVDKRTDIWAFGCVVYELLTGRRAFAGDDVTDLIVAVMTTDPDWTALPSTTPPRIVELLKRCLKKSPRERVHDIADARLEIDDAIAQVRTGAATRLRMPWRPVRVAAVAVAAAIATWAVFGRRSPDAGSITLTNPRQVTSAQGAEWFPTWSPEGSRVAYQDSDNSLWVTQLTGSSVQLRELAFYPSWSPDGTQIAFASFGSSAGYFVMPALGGGARKILAEEDADLGRPVWSPDGSRLAGVTQDPSSGRPRLEIITLQSMTSTYVPLAGRETWRADMSWSANGDLVAYLDAVANTPDVTQLWVVRLSDGHATALTDGMTNARTPSFSPDSRVVYYVSNRGGSPDLWAQALAPDGSVVGDPRRVTTGVGMSTAAFSRDGSKLAYSRGPGLLANAWRVPLTRDRRVTWADAQQLTFDEAFIEFMDVSPDGSELFFSSNRRGNQDIWRMPAAGGEMQPVTSDPAPDWRPSISPDRKQLLFYAYRSGTRDLWIMPLAGGPARQLTAHAGGNFHPVWSPDGSRIAFASTRSGAFNVLLVAANGGEPIVVAGNPGDNLPSWSPDGRWIAFVRTTPAGQQLFRAPAAGGEAEQITRSSVNSLARWSRDGRSLYFTRGQQIWEVTLGTGVERQLTDFSGRPGLLGSFSLATDGTWLYFAFSGAQADIWTMDVVRGQ